MISCKALTKCFGAITALDALSLEVPDKSVFGFLGPNGAGKTTCVRMLTGLSFPTSGEAYVAGEKVSPGSFSLRKKFGYLPETPAFYDWMTAVEFLRFSGELYGLSPEDIKKRSGELLELVELKSAARRKVGGYSRGMKQRLGLAQALLNRPPVLFLDEPTSALDPIGRRDVLNLILCLKESATIFMSTHILSDVERVCDSVAIVNKGKLITTSTVEALRNRYATSAIELEFDQDPTPFAAHLKNFPWMRRVEIQSKNGARALYIDTSDIERAKKDLPVLIGASGLSLVRYEVTSPTLEDIFINIVGEAPRA